MYTYQDLLAWLNTLSEEQLRMNVSVLLSEQNEFVSLSSVAVNEKGLDNFNQIDPDQPYLMVDC